MYETWHINNAAATTADSTLLASQVEQTPHLLNNYTPYGSGAPETNDYIVFVHGWRMQWQDKQEFANTAYKRLFWQGYKGRFGAFDWPTEWVDTHGTIPWRALLDPQNYDRSEEKAWHSGVALHSLLVQLDQDYGYEHVNLVAHSMGNIVASEALRQAGGTKIAHSYVASQASTVAEAYEPTAPKNLFTGTLSGFGPAYPSNTMSIYENLPITNRAYFEDFDSAADKLVNFLNPLDYATMDALNNPPHTWRLNQATKPDTDRAFAGSYAEYTWQNGSYLRFTYTYEPDGEGNLVKVYAGPGTPLNLAVASDLYEAFSYAAEPRSYAAGAQPGLSGPGKAFNSELDLSSAVALGNQSFGRNPWDHSAQFMSTNARRWRYWSKLLDAMNLPHANL